MEASENNGPYNIWAEEEITVEFYDVDPLRVVWHGNYIHYFEIGRRCLLEKIGYDYSQMEESGFAFPVTKISAKYIGSLHYRDRARIKAILVEYENLLKIRYEIRNAQTGQIITKGTSSQMAYDLKTKKSCFECPRVLINKIEILMNGKKA
ncbi:MAG: acyl-CoA thioesterase [Spirochaetes bacterium]|nr:acyl-CoA thioesterase [Spirochaetota bacterium]